MTNHTNKLNRITRLLSAFTVHRIHASLDTELKWGTPLPENIHENEEKLNQTSSSIIVPLYYYPDISKDMMINSFSNQRHNDIALIEHRYYYYYDPIDSKEKEITFPVTIESSLEKYFSLNKKDQRTVDTICHLICNGIDLRLQK